MTYIVASFYQFIDLSHYEILREPFLAAMKEYQIKGTIILAKEGINGSFCGTEDQVTHFKSLLNQSIAIDLRFQDSVSEVNPFSKAKVKLRKEIVTIGDMEINPAENTGIHVTPAAWNALISDPETVVIDTRNHYEVALGTFKGAINPHTENFRDFPDYVEQTLSDKKDKKIAMFCTGGIRCEKSTALLKKLGFEKVYQLDGGILNYLQSVPAPKSLWEGSCFVFDDRVALDHQLNHLPLGSIDTEWKNNSKKKARDPG